MALDGIFLRFIKTELEQALFSRVEKVYQPSKNELVLLLRSRNAAYKLLMTADASSPRVHFISEAPENPQNPPMLCMLLRKKLCGSSFSGVRQQGLDRVLFLDFDGTNEIGDPERLTLCIEIMAQHSNIILMDSENRIIDSIKRVDALKSSVRQILPGLTYVLPPAQDKLDITLKDTAGAVDLICQKGVALSSALLKTLQGVSPLVCRELAFYTAGDDVAADTLDAPEKQRLADILEGIKKSILENTGTPVCVFGADGKPADFSFMRINQYGADAVNEQLGSYSQVLERFYSERDRLSRSKSKASDLFKTVANTRDRLAKKLFAQQDELKKCADRETLKIYAELITANQYALEKGSLYYDLPNYYDENRLVRIAANPALSPSQNAQKYYKEYRKAHTAEQMLTSLIESGTRELEYLDTVSDALSRADGERELSEIRSELENGGYMRSRRGTQKKTLKRQQELPPLEFFTSDGFRVLVGRNNVQNDRLSMKLANKNDIWLHAQKMPGSHTVIDAQGREITDSAIVEAAEIAAYYSSGRESTLVTVDYTEVKNLKKPQGAKPGYVIYHVYNSVNVRPKTEKL
ncbi:MAG: fibronectin/fibrinogen-binding protein [Clostridiales bacterium]|nr:fibronectin/fibrinogen-binding protein [Clostridiales bacterium]